MGGWAGGRVGGLAWLWRRRTVCALWRGKAQVHRQLQHHAHFLARCLPPSRVFSRFLPCFPPIPCVAGSLPAGHGMLPLRPPRLPGDAAGGEAESALCCAALCWAVLCWAGLCWAGLESCLESDAHLSYAVARCPLAVPCSRGTLLESCLAPSHPGQPAVVGSTQYFSTSSCLMSHIHVHVCRPAPTPLCRTRRLGSHPRQRQPATVRLAVPSVHLHAARSRCRLLLRRLWQVFPHGPLSNVQLPACAGAVDEAALLMELAGAPGGPWTLEQLGWVEAVAEAVSAFPFRC